MRKKNKINRRFHFLKELDIQKEKKLDEMEAVLEKAFQKLEEEARKKIKEIKANKIRYEEKKFFKDKSGQAIF